MLLQALQVVLVAFEGPMPFVFKSNTQPINVIKENVHEVFIISFSIVFMLMSA